MGTKSALGRLISKHIIELIKTTSCIPTSSTLKQPNVIVDPASPYADLFDASDNVFPTIHITARARDNLISKLGMKNSACDFTWDDISCLVSKVEKLACAQVESANKASSLVIELIIYKLMTCPVSYTHLTLPTILLV